MKKLLGSFVLCLAVASLLTITGVTVAPAQVKKKTTKAQPKAAELGAVEVYTDKAGKWRYRVKNPEGKSIAIGTVGFKDKDDVIKVLDQLKVILNESKVVVIENKK